MAMGWPVICFRHAGHQVRRSYPDRSAVVNAQSAVEMNGLPTSPANTRSGQAHVAQFVTALAFVVALGFLLHTSHDRIVLNKYNVRYTVYLGVVFLIGLPLLYS